MVWISAGSAVGVRVAARLVEREPVVLAVPYEGTSHAKTVVSALLGRDPGDKLTVLPEATARAAACEATNTIGEVWRLSCVTERDDSKANLWADVARELGVPFRVFHLDAVAEKPAEVIPGAFSIFMQALHETVEEIRSRDRSYFDRRALRTTLPTDFGALDAESAACEVISASSGPPVECRVAPTIIGRHSLSDSIGEAYELELVMGAKPFTLTAVDRLLDSRLRGIGGCSNLTAKRTRKARMLDAAELNRIILSWRQYHADSLRAERFRLCAFPASAEICSDDGVNPAFHVFGEGGPVIVIVNAIAQDDRYWARLIDRLAHEHRVVTWTQRTFGNDGQTATFADHVRDLNAVVHAVTDEPVHLVGWCTGPKLCTQYCLSHPRRVASMVFLAGTYRPFGDAHFDTDYEIALEMVFRLLDRSPQAAAMVRTTLLDAVGVGHSRLASAEDPGSEVLARIDPALLSSVSAPYADDESTLRYARQIREFWDYSIEEDVRAIQIPVIVIGAELDRIASSRLGLRVAQAMPDARYIELPGATHYCMYDRPDEVASIIGRFIRDPRGALAVAPAEVCL